MAQMQEWKEKHRNAEHCDEQVGLYGQETVPVHNKDEFAHRLHRWHRCKNGRKNIATQSIATEKQMSKSTYLFLASLFLTAGNILSVSSVAENKL